MQSSGIYGLKIVHDLINTSAGFSRHAHGHLTAQLDYDAQHVSHASKYRPFDLKDFQKLSEALLKSRYGSAATHVPEDIIEVREFLLQTSNMASSHDGLATVEGLAYKYLQVGCRLFCGAMALKSLRKHLCIVSVA